MELLIISIIIFAVSMAIIELAKGVWKNTHPDQRMQNYVTTEKSDGSVNIERKRLFSTVPWIHSMLQCIPGTHRLDRLIEQANAKHLADFYVSCMSVVSIVGFVVSAHFLHRIYLSLVISLVLSMLPILQLKQLKRQRLKKFREQLPEGLEMISRALKAGHAFTSGMRLAADQFSEPLNTEFEETLSEINFGISVPDALHRLARRIDCQELKYFVVAVILQRETGGNLAEIIENLSRLIRENFKFVGKVRTLAAEGKLSAIILVLLPFFIIGYLHIVNREYLSLLFEHPLGQLMAIGAGIMMCIGVFVLRKMVQIKF